jgi:hypothetical protein
MKSYVFLVLLGATAVTAEYAANASKTAFYIDCQLAGQTTKAAVDKDKICAQIKSQIRATMNKSSMQKGDWVKVMLTMPAPNKLDANVSRKRAGKTVTYPIVGIRIYDRAMSNKDVVQLGNAIVANMKKR